MARRQAAYATDFILWLALGRVLFRHSGMMHYVKEHATPGRYWMAVAIVLFGYRFLFLFKDGFSGFSPGKWAHDLRVVDESTRVPIGPFRSLSRNMILLIPIVGEMIVWAQLHFGDRWFDKAAKCKVIAVVDEEI